jgi:hypothetical protein
MNDKKMKILSIACIMFAMLTIFSVAGYYNGKDIINRVPFMSMISHTEYRSGEAGQLIARLVDYQDVPVTVNWCKAYINYPDKSVWVNGDLMLSDSGNLTGNHYYTFTVPTTVGTYEYAAECNFNKTPSLTITRKVVNSFHVSPALNDIAVINQTLFAMNSSLTNQASWNFGNLTTQINGVNYNVSLIYQDTQYLKGHALDIDGNFTALNVRLDGVDSNLTVLKNYCSDSNTNTSALCVMVSELKYDIAGLNATIIGTTGAYLSEINATTHNTYDYITSTLAGNVLNIYNEIIATQATVNATYILAQAVNGTTTTILSNQQDDWRMSVSSG